MSIKKLKSLFFTLTVKTPITILVIILFTFSLLITMAYRNYTDVYLKLQGTIEQSETDKTNYIKANIDEKYINAINKNSKIVWYVSTNGKRYDGNILELGSKNKDNLYTTNIAAEAKDINYELKNSALTQNKQVTIEICIKKIRILDKILKKNNEV